MSVTSLTMPLEDVVRPFGVRDRGVVFTDGAGAEQRLSYDALARHAAGAAQALAALGVSPGATVGLALETTPKSIALLLGAWIRGACVASLPPVRHGEEDAYRAGIGAALERLGCRQVIADGRLATTLAGNAHVVALDAIDLEACAAPVDTPAPRIALVQFTSGSTGAPKGIALSPWSLAGHLEAIGLRLEVDPDRDRAVSWLPLHHDMGLVGFLLTALRWRVDLVLTGPRQFARDPGIWLALCARHRATMTGGPDFAYRLAARLAQLRSPGRLDALRVCLSGAERIAWTTLEEFENATAPAGLRWEALLPVYGLAEATLAVSFSPLGRGPRRAAGGGVRVGTPLPGVEVELRDRGAAGEGRIALRSPWLLDHYATVTGAVDPCVDGWLETNDIGCCDDGELVVLGRADETVIVAGRNVYAEDVELIALGAAAPAAVLAAAFRWPAGEGLALAVEVAATSPAQAAGLAGKVQRAVAGAVGVRPAPVLVLMPLALPRTTSGKVQRARCRQLLAEGGWPRQTVLAARP